MTRQYIRSYRANSLPDALRMVTDDLGPDAAVLDTRQVWDGWLKGLIGKRRVEVTASVPIVRAVPQPAAVLSCDTTEAPHPPTNVTPSPQPDRFGELESGLAQLKNRLAGPDEAVFKLYAEMVENEFTDEQARELVAQLQEHLEPGTTDLESVTAEMRELLQTCIRTGGPIATAPGARRTVALVGPTGVGKTTTIAKLAANFRLREKKKVGLITVDTYRIAAVEQLRTYADIIDLPMEVVSTPREMREAMHRMSSVDLILMDTAGRSPRDEIKLQELKVMLGEAGADEVHLVMSATSGPRALTATAKHFANVGATSLLLTKLDEATGLGHLAGLLRSATLPLSYLTNGQNVPEDIQIADSEKLSGWMLGQGREAIAPF